jgi:hypothetical protein
MATAETTLTSGATIGLQLVVGVAAEGGAASEIPGEATGIMPSSANQDATILADFIGVFRLTNSTVQSVIGGRRRPRNAESQGNDVRGIALSNFERSVDKLS